MEKGKVDSEISLHNSEFLLEFKGFYIYKFEIDN